MSFSSVKIMNKWECDHCYNAVLGCGNPVGLRAIGWFVRLYPGGCCVILCPQHFPGDGEAMGLEQAILIQSSPVIAGDMWTHPIYKEWRARAAAVEPTPFMTRVEESIPGINPICKRQSKKRAKATPQARRKK